MYSSGIREKNQLRFSVACMAGVGHELESATLDSYIYDTLVIVSDLQNCPSKMMIF